MSSLHGGKSNRATFHKSERLKSRKEIETLFRSGEAFYVGSLRVVFRIQQYTTSSASKLQAGFSIPKKKIRHANKRNRIKRLLKEAWRLQKHTLLQQIPDNLQMHVFVIFMQNSFQYSFSQAEQHIHKTILQLGKLFQQ